VFGKLVQGFLDFFNNLFSVFKKSPTEKVQDRKDDAEETLEISGEHLHVLKKCLRCETDFVEVYDMTWVDMSHYNPKES